MILAAPLSSPRRLVALAATVLVLVASLTGCGSSAPASVPPAASIAAATPAPVASTPAASAPAEPSAPTSGASAPAAGADPAAGLTIDAPYTLTALPGALQQTLETQFASGVGAFGSAVQVGFRQIGGGNAAGSILMVIAFPAGSLSATAYQAALAGMGSSMGAAFTTSTVEGVDVASGTASTGGVGVFHIGDHMLVVISPSAAEALPIATALIKANN
jgi:predicted small lipoprotein YifL